MSASSSPEVLFLDEVTSGLDVQSSRLIRSLVRELNEEAGCFSYNTLYFITSIDLNIVQKPFDVGKTVDPKGG